MNFPTCAVLGCGLPVSYRKTFANGNYSFRSVCSKHHKMKLKTTKLNYCENIDGHLGFGPCTATIVSQEQLHLDHVDGNRYNNSSENLRTYCANCHATKTVRNKDHLGRYNSVAKTTFNNIFELGE
jgi:hypothetical protein